MVAVSESIYFITCNESLLLQSIEHLMYIVFLFDRNEVWRYDQKIWGNRRTRIIRFLFRGFPLGFAAFVATCGVEYSLGMYDNHGHGAHGGHGEGDGHSKH